MMARKILILILVSFLPLMLSAQEGSRRYSVRIEIGEAYVSGICLMREDADCVTATLMNEFGISALSWRYDRSKDRIKILDMLRQLKKPGFKRTLRSDLRKIMQSGVPGEPYTHVNRRHDIIYHFAPLSDETE